jgi:hypothetical protein
MGKANFNQPSSDDTTYNKRTMSAAARTKIAAFQRAKWAKIKQQKKAA